MKKILYILVPLLLTIATLVYFFNTSEKYSLYTNFKYAVDSTNFTNPIDTFKDELKSIQSLSLRFSIDTSNIFNFLSSIFTCIYTFFQIIINVIKIPFQIIIDLISDIILFFSFIWKVIGFNGFNL